MRLVTVYIPENTIPYLFGEAHQGLTINFGGTTSFEITSEKGRLNITKSYENPNFVKALYGEPISLISAIVGRNGIGKTSILRALNSTGDSKKINSLFLFESESGDFFAYNELEEVINSDIEIKLINTKLFESSKLFYTPIVDAEQKNIRSRLNIVSTGEENLDEIYLKQIVEDIILLNDPILETLKTVYPDFPEYKELEIGISQHRRTDFKSVYGSANLGNQDRQSVLKIYLESDIGEIDSGKWDDFLGSSSFLKDQLERYVRIIESESLNSLFDRLWEMEEYSHELGNDKIHGENDFIKNFEVTLFSYFILDATFPQTPFQGAFDFQKILDRKTFKDRFNGFVELYFANIYDIVRNNILEKFGEINIENYDELKSLIEEDVNRKFTQSGFKSSDAVKLMLRYLDRFKSLYDLYSILIKLINEKKFELRKGHFVYRRTEHNAQDFYDLTNQYDKVLELNSGFVYRLDLLSIRSTYPLSSGEKSLLNFFSRINTAINRLKISNHPKLDYYLILLDEPELGYHPIWKRKFINAVVKSFPVLFSRIKPEKSVFELDQVEDVTVQIIFSTHDPLTLSDIPSNNVTFIDRDDDSELSFLIDKESEGYPATFGANVHDLLSESFFLENGFMGEYVQELITDLINYLNLVDSEKSALIDVKLLHNWNQDKAEKVIGLIDEPLIKDRVQSLYNKKFLYHDKELLRLKIRQLNNQLNKLEGEEN